MSFLPRYCRIISRFKHILITEEHITILCLCRNYYTNKRILFYLNNFAVFPYRLMC